MRLISLIGAVIKSAALGAFVLVGVVGCSTMSPEQELELGRQLHPEFEKQSGGVYPDQAIQDYVARVGRTMAQYAGRPDMDWQFRVVSDDQINAFAVPGGYIYITQGLLFRLNNEAQLAGILGHEAGHIAGRHSAKQIQTQQQAAVGAGLAGLLGGLAGYQGVGDIAGTVAQLGVMSYGRDQEREADMLGLKYMSLAGYNPKGLVQAMEILRDASAGNEPPEFLSTHPNPGNRIEYLTDTINDEYRQAARTGRLDEQEFRNIVLSRRPTALRIDRAGDIPPAIVWCLTCRAEAVAAATITPDTELLHDVSN